MSNAPTMLKKVVNNLFAIAVIVKETYNSKTHFRKGCKIIQTKFSDNIRPTPRIRDEVIKNESVESKEDTK